jgi:PAS domain S-box-containing protein
MARRDVVTGCTPGRSDLAPEARVRGLRRDENVLGAEVQAVRAELDAERERYLELFDFSPVGYVTLDRAGIIRSSNLAAARLFGLERGRLVGFPMVTRVAPPDRRRFLDYLLECRSGGQAPCMELTLGGAGQGTPVQLLSKAGDTAGGGSILMALVDLTAREAAALEQSRIEDERRRVEHAHEITRAESAAKDRFLAVLSHELRNPLAPILFTIETLERGGLPPDRIAPALAIIRRSVDLEVRLIDDLLDVSRITHGKLRIERRVISLHDVVTDVVASTVNLARDRTPLVMALDATNDRVEGDPVRLRQVVSNLLSNALRNTPPGGRITIATRTDGDDVVLSVSDSGRGIAPAMLARIFEPFDQIDAPGSVRGGLGLGLAICRGLVEAHGGRIDAASEGPGRGAVFTVRLATVHAAQPVGPADEEAPPPAQRRLRLLVVEDDPDVAESMRLFLELRGHGVVVAHSVAEAVALADATFDVVVSDIGLPDGTGIDVMTNLRKRLPIRGIALSGFGTVADVRRSLDAGFDRHMTKPVDPEDLIAVIEPLAS